MVKLFFEANLVKKALKKYTKISDAFTLEILQTFTDIRYEDSISSIEQFKAQSLWRNSLIRVGNRPICYRSWYSKRVKNVCHLIRDETNYLSFSDCKERYNIKTNILTFQGVISAIKSLWKTYDVNNHCCNTKCENLIDMFLKTSKPSRLAYKIIVDKKQNSLIDSHRKWTADCMLESDDSINWKVVYRTPFLCTRISQFILLAEKFLQSDWL